MTVAREANAPMPSAIRSVLPWVTRMASGGTPRASAQIWASAVSMPWPTEAAPVTTSMPPSASSSTLASSKGPSPLFSTKKPRPKPTFSPRRAAQC